MSHQRNTSSPVLIKLGKISKSLESKMEIALASDINIYLLEATANAYATEYPESYLTLIEEIATVIRKPDAFSFDKQKEEFHFLRLFPQDGQLFLLDACVEHRGSPRRWIMTRFCAHKDLREVKVSNNISFQRI